MNEESFVVRMHGVPIPKDARQRIEQAINEAVKVELAKIDTRGDLEVTPLSQLKSYGGGAGDATAGAYVGACKQGR